MCAGSIARRLALERDSLCVLPPQTQHCCPWRGAAQSKISLPFAGCLEAGTSNKRTTSSTFAFFGVRARQTSFFLVEVCRSSSISDARTFRELSFLCLQRYNFAACWLTLQPSSCAFLSNTLCSKAIPVLFDTPRRVFSCLRFAFFVSFLLLLGWHNFTQTLPKTRWYGCVV